MNKFETGRTYHTTSTGDSGCVITETIARRTAKTVTTMDGKTFRVRIWYDGTCEYFKPWGSFSMAPSIKASA
jgi:hypothetical protein